MRRRLRRRPMNIRMALNLWSSFYLFYYFSKGRQVFFSLYRFIQKKNLNAATCRVFISHLITNLVLSHIIVICNNMHSLTVSAGACIYTSP